MGVRLDAVGVNRMMIVNRNLWVGLEPWGENIGGQMFYAGSSLFMKKQDIGSQALHLGSLSCIKKQNIGGETLHLKLISGILENF